MVCFFLLVVKVVTLCLPWLGWGVFILGWRLIYVNCVFCFGRYFVFLSWRGMMLKMGFLSFIRNGRLLLCLEVIRCVRGAECRE